MLYSLAKILMTAGLRFFYRRIYTTGLEYVPANGPAIIIANHNASLMDAALLGILLKRKAYFFARGDVFVNKPVRRILWWLHMMPVHGHQGGRNTLSANDNSFSNGQQILMNGGIVVFFPESTSHIEHQLLPFRKGVFRLAFDTAKAAGFSFDIPIVPVGISYDHPVDCRATVQVHAGKPLLLLDYKNEYYANASAALLHICRDAYQAVMPLVLHIEDRQRLVTAEQYLVISRQDKAGTASTWKIASKVKLEKEQVVYASINTASETEFNKKQQLAEYYFSNLVAAGVTDKAVSGKLSFSWPKKILYWFGFPVFAAGLLLNGLPVLIARWIADKKVYRTDFYSWIFVACYSCMYFLWLLLAVLVFSSMGWRYMPGLTGVMIATGLFAYQYKDWLKESKEYSRWQALSSTQMTELKTMRNELVSA